MKKVKYNILPIITILLLIIINNILIIQKQCNIYYILLHSIYLILSLNYNNKFASRIIMIISVKEIIYNSVYQLIIIDKIIYIATVIHLSFYIYVITLILDNYVRNRKQNTGG